MAKKKIGQADRVLEYIRAYGSITRVQALNDLGVANLPAVINDLRNSGVSIDTVNVAAINRYNEKCTYAKYVLN